MVTVRIEAEAEEGKAIEVVERDDHRRPEFRVETRHGVFGQLYVVTRDGREVTAPTPSLREAWCWKWEEEHGVVA